ncbi:class I SAM-dependent DNA methyltransferase [Corynebacterium ulcerans]|nr:class I SAM-dependent methyltransferase [Corynebacterium ulcerans]QQU25565.1 class I SAM-dependent methyltransferase [Corynebacterium ulcerans]
MPTWKDMTTRNPEHSRNYAARWDNLAAAGNDIVGEARLIDAMAQRGARILDAGCGQGRIGGYLSERGHTVVGVDIDDYLISQARLNYPHATWHVTDLGCETIPDNGFELVVCAGNVMTFIAPENRADALKNIYDATAVGGRCVLGFGAGRGYIFPHFFEDLRAAGFSIDANFESWDLRPFSEESTFLVSIVSKN